ncbi:unnamed protein product [Trifolium pratense]|uniref:Uncharacterized protein n=1 Tax=Trifolium pratense TaxID=57577 RepID=A0ACB0J7E3_TRIPR|nr:unnamed protein product [Trifolium pratense]
MVQAKARGANVVEVAYPYCLSWPNCEGGLHDDDVHVCAVASVKACFGIRGCFFYRIGSQGIPTDSKLLLDATAGGSLLSLSAADATTIIEKMSLSDRQSERSKTQRKPGILELDPSDAVLAQNKLLTNTVEELSKQMSKLMTLQEVSTKAKQVAACELCTGDHPTGHCPPSNEEVNFMGAQQRQGQYQNTGYQRGNNSNYGQGWRQDVGSSNRQRQYENYSQPPPQQSQQTNLEETLKSFMEMQTKHNQQQHQQMQTYQRGNDAVLRNLETQIGQIAREMANNKNQGGSFAANTEPNPKEQCKSVTTRSGKEVGKGIGDNLNTEEEVLTRKEKEGDLIEESEKGVEENNEGDLVENQKNEKNEKEEELEGEVSEEKRKKKQKAREEKSIQKNPPVQHLPYPHAPSKKDKERQYARFLDIFKRLQINIPFAEALEQMPTYAKFMKEILTKKRKFDDDEVIQLDASCSAIIQRTLPTKEKDPGRVTLPVTIGNVNVGKALIDLGSSINLIPLSVIKRIGGLDVTRTRMTLQLADKSITRPSGMAEDVLVKVDKFMFPIDFVVMDIEEDDDVPLILGRPFMKTARMMIDIDDGVMKVRVQDEEVSFNLWEAIKHPNEKDICFKLDATDEAILDVRKQAHQPSSLEQALTESFEALDPEKEEEVESFLKQLDALKEVTPLEAKIEELKNDERPGEIKLELKTLPSHLKYAFLEEEEKKPVIISNSLSADEEKSLIQILKENKEAIGWSLSDLKELDVFEKDTRYRDDLLHLICTDFSLKGKVKGLTDECRVLFKIILAAISPRVGGTDTISWTHRHLLYFLLTGKKVNLGDYFFERICEAIFASKSQRKTTIVYPRLLSDLLYQGHVVQNLKKFHPELVEKKFSPEILHASFLTKMRLISTKLVPPPQELSARLEDRLYVDGYPIISEADAEHIIQDYLEVLRKEGFIVDRSMIPPAPANLYNPSRRQKRKAEPQADQPKPDLLAQKRIKVEQADAEKRTKKKHEETATKDAEGASKEPIVVEVDSSSEESESEDETESDEETLAERLRRRPVPVSKGKGKSSKYIFNETEIGIGYTKPLRTVLPTSDIPTSDNPLSELEKHLSPDPLNNQTFTQKPSSPLKPKSPQPQPQKETPIISPSEPESHIPITETITEPTSPTKQLSPIKPAEPSSQLKSPEQSNPEPTSEPIPEPQPQPSAEYASPERIHTCAPKPSEAEVVIIDNPATKTPNLSTIPNPSPSSSNPFSNLSTQFHDDLVRLSLLKDRFLVCPSDVDLEVSSIKARICHALDDAAEEIKAVVGRRDLDVISFMKVSLARAELKRLTCFNHEESERAKLEALVAAEQHLSAFKVCWVDSKLFQSLEAQRVEKERLEEAAARVAQLANEIQQEDALEEDVLDVLNQDDVLMIDYPEEGESSDKGKAPLVEEQAPLIEDQAPVVVDQLQIFQEALREQQEGLERQRTAHLNLESKVDGLVSNVGSLNDKFDQLLAFLKKP